MPDPGAVADRILSGRLGIAASTPVRFVGFMSFILAVASCGDQGGTVRGTRHPVIDPAPSSSGVTMDSESSVPPDLRRVAERMAKAEQTVRIGTLEGDPATVFGYIVDLALSADGDVYVVDAHAHQVRRFSQDGTVRGVYGRSGDGPDEFRAPVALDFASSTLLVPGTRFGFKMFDVGSGTFNGVRTVAVGPDIPSPTDLCVAGGRVQLRGRPAGAEATVFAVDFDGDPATSYGRGYEAGSWLVRSQMSEGRIACDKASGTVVVSFTYLPRIDAYSVDGTFRWSTTIDDFTPLTFIESSEGGRSTLTSRRANPGDMILSTTAVPGGYALVQIARLGPAEITGRPEGAVQLIRRLDSYVLSTGSGGGAYVGSGLPQIMYATGDRLWGVDTDSVAEYPIVVGMNY